MKKSLSATIRDLNADEVSIEVNLLRGLPRINLVGLASSEVKESVERVRSALSESGFKLPPKVITINLSPSEIKKRGSHFDLGISLLIAMFDSDEVDFLEWHIFGELGLDGSVKDSNAIFPAILSLKRAGKIKKVLVPKSSVEKISQIPDIEIYGVETIAEAVDHFKGIITLKPIIGNELNSESLKIFEKSYHFLRDFPLDFNQVFGQNIAKKASLISVSGLHNMILEGSPGSGKSMIAKRLQYILPPLEKDELLDIARFEALNGEDPTFQPKRPFRSPHHTASKGSIFGGGTRTAKIGEVSMANSGILFFDELPHFPKQVLEAMREPLQDYSILVSRVNSKIEYPANFLFVGAMNPCPCGYSMSKTKSCRCTDFEIRKYQNILSEPFWDRIDLYIAMDEVTPEDTKSTSSSEIFEKMLEAFYKQIERGQTKLNGRLNESELQEYSQLSEKGLDVLKRGSERFGLSLRGMNKVQKVARTIADLDSSKNIEKNHILEALSYRRRN